MAASDSFRFPACNFIKRDSGKDNFLSVLQIFKNIFWQNTSRCLLLLFICEFWICSDRPFYRAPLGNWLFHVQVAGFQPPDAVKRYLTGDFQVFYTRTRSSYSKAFIYLKSLRISCALFVKKLISAIWKSPHQHLGISIDIDVSIGIAKKFFVLQSFYLCLLKYLMKKISMVKSFSSTLAHLIGSFSHCLEQLFCRKPVSTCFWRKELHSRRYLRSFKNTHGWKLHFAGL